MIGTQEAMKRKVVSSIALFSTYPSTIITFELRGIETQKPQTISNTHKRTSLLRLTGFPKPSNPPAMAPI